MSSSLFIRPADHRGNKTPPISSLEGHGEQKGDIGATQVVYKSSSSVAPLRTGSYTDKQLHEWNYKHNPNYDSNLYDPISETFR